MAKPRVAILGLGIMGGGMAGRLLSAGFPLSVYNRSRERRSHSRRRERSSLDLRARLRRGAEIVISMVADDAASREVWLGDKRSVSGSFERFDC